MEQARIEFTNFAELPIDSIGLYQKTMGIWNCKETLIQFEENETEFLQLNNTNQI